MSERRTVANVDVDTIKAQEELAALVRQTELTAQGVMRTVNKGYQATILFLDLFDIVLPQSLALMATASMQAGQMFADLAAAETISGVLAAKAGLTLTAASIMFVRGMVLMQEKTEAENKIHSMLMLLQLGTGV